MIIKTRGISDFYGIEEKTLSIKKELAATKESIEATKESLASIGGFFSDLKNEGIWFAFTGENFGPWIHDMTHTLINGADILVIPALFFLLMIMAGFKKKGGLYLHITIFTFLLIKFLGVAV